MFEASRRPPGIPFASRRLRGSPAATELIAIVNGRLRLGRPRDPSYPAPIRSSGRAVSEVQRALIDLGFRLPRHGADGRYGNETYQAVLSYKRARGIRTQGGYLDGIVGPLTTRSLDRDLRRLERGPWWVPVVQARRT